MRSNYPELKALQGLDDGLARRLHGFLGGFHSIFYSDESPPPARGAKPNRETAPI